MGRTARFAADSRGLGVDPYTTLGRYGQPEPLKTTEMYYYAIDGDDVGRKLEALVLSNDVEGLQLYSRTIKEAMQSIRERLDGADCSIILCAGDSILAGTPRRLPNELTPTLVQGISFSIGVGRTPADALLALKRAKGLGRGRLECLNTD